MWEAQEKEDRRAKIIMKGLREKGERMERKVREVLNSLGRRGR